VSTYFGRSPAIGHHLQLTQATYGVEPALNIVGVVGDAREESLNQEPLPTVYTCGNDPDPNRTYIVRTYADPHTLFSTIRQRIHQIEPNRSVYDLSSLEESLFDSIAENRFRTLLLSLFALTAISLACVGIYGTLSYFVSIRNREVGLRIALGAVPNQILLSFLSRGLYVATLGCAVGLGLASALSRFLSGMLYGVSRSDAATYMAVIITVLPIAAFASFLPAVRASRLDPMRVLRNE
jgi:putative ABC transport system permease protein